MWVTFGGHVGDVCEDMFKELLEILLLLLILVVVVVVVVALLLLLICLIHFRDSSPPTNYGKNDPIQICLHPFKSNQNNA